MRRPDGTTFIHDCDTQGCWIKAHAAPFDLLADAFGGAIRPTDIDGQVERKGYFLTVEWKQRGADIPQGQRLMFENLTRTLHPEGQRHTAFTVFIVWHEAGRPYDVYQMCSFREGKQRPIYRTDISGIWDACFAWYVRIEPGFASRKESVRERFQQKIADIERS